MTLRGIHNPLSIVPARNTAIGFDIVMRMLQCVADVNPAWGGSVEAARLLTVALLKQGHTVEVLTLVEPKPEWMEEWGTVAYCPGPSATYYLYNNHLAGWLKENARNYDIFIIHGVWRYISVGVWRGLRSLDIPYVIYPHGMLDPYYNGFAWKRLKKLFMWKFAERKVLRDANMVLFTCEEERLLACVNFHPLVCKQEVVGLGIAAPPSAPEGASSVSAAWPQELLGKRVILFLARLHPQKGCDTLIEAFARVAAKHSDLHLLIVGPDEIGWKAELARKAESLGATRQITWSVPVYGDNKWAFFRKADAYILPTNFENFGISIVEALACGLPVLISNKAAVWREIERAQAGFVSENTVPGTVEILEKWTAAPVEQRDRMRANAVQCFRENYDIDVVATRLMRVVETIVAR
jgi:glycosyltransferase involved in cell wall biosynthesis